MKLMKWFGGIATALCLAAQLSAGPLPVPPLKAEIPFAFQMGGRTYPAGTYVFSASAEKGMVAITDADGHSRFSFAVSTGDAWDWSDSKIVFVNDGGVKRVSEVHANTVVYQVFKPKRNASSVQIAFVR